MSDSKRGVAIVTGAGSGLGRALAIDLARKGFQVCVTDLKIEAALETLELLPTSKDSQAYQLDVSSPASIRQFEENVSHLPLKVLINNAGLQHVAAVEDFSVDKWQQMIDVMLVGPFALTQAFLPTFRREGFGRIVNIGSIHSLVASSHKSAYVAAKHGLLGLAKTVALETADVDVTINTICPSYIRTPLVDAQLESQAKVHGLSVEQVIDQIFLAPMPKKAFITFEEVAAAVKFLIDPLARNITGQTIVIDGGWTIR
jgi:3-hydroxybutyrate dehydrogenase